MATTAKNRATLERVFRREQAAPRPAVPRGRPSAYSLLQSLTAGASAAVCFLAALVWMLGNLAVRGMLAAVCLLAIPLALVGSVVVVALIIQAAGIVLRGIGLM